MYLEATESARLYTLLSNKLGNETTEALFKYIDDKTKRSVEATIKALATKEDLTRQIEETRKTMTHKINWLFIYWIIQYAVTIAILVLLLNKPH